MPELLAAGRADLPCPNLGELVALLSTALALHEHHPVGSLVSLFTDDGLRPVAIPRKCHVDPLPTSTGTLGAPLYPTHQHVAEDKVLEMAAVTAAECHAVMFVGWGLPKHSPLVQLHTRFNRGVPALSP